MRQRLANATVPIAESPRVSIGPYQVIAPLARGGTATVFLAEHDDTKERVALKLLHASYAGHADIVERMFAERSVSRAVTHPALLDVREAETTSTGLPYLMMEYLDGENLGVLAERGRLEIDAIVAMAMQVAGALVALHRAGYVHCDIKPDNIFILYRTNPFGWPLVKLIDYGVSIAVDTPPSDDATIAGTPAYMPPEQWCGRATPKSDLYALGCTLYELVTGEQPYHGTLPQLMLAHSETLTEAPSTRRSDLPPALERLIMRLLSKDTDLRPTAAETESELRQISHALSAPIPLPAVA